jgi:hypothetical protein
MDGRPVEARAPGALHQARLFVRRNRALVAGATAVLLVSVVGAIVSMHFALTSHEAEQDARRKAHEAETQRGRFESLFQAQFGQSMDAVARHARAMLGTLGGAPVAKDMLTETIRRLEHLETLAEGDRGVTRGLVEAYLRLAEASSSYGNPERSVEEQAFAALGNALTLTEGLADSESGEPGDALLRLRVLARLANQANESEAEARRAQGARWLEAAREGLSRSDLPPRTAARIHFALATAAKAKGAWDEVEAEVSAEMRSLEHHIDAHPDDGVSRAMLADAFARRADARLHRGAVPGAVADFQRELEILEPLAQGSPGDIDLGCLTAGAFIDQGYAMALVGRVDGMARAYEEAGKQIDALLAEAPRHFLVLWVQARRLEAEGQLAMTRALREHGRGTPERTAGIQRAVECWREGLSVYEEIDRHGRLEASMQAHAEKLRTIIARTEAMAGGERH